MKQVLEGSQAVAEAVRLARVQVVSAYPITPQTHIVEILSDYCATGKMNAKFLRVESEHSCMAALIGAQSSGVRTFTATSGQGLALMHELLHWASGARLPIVMAEVNRALAPGWNIWVDQTDSLAQRDTGWIQFYCEDSQEVIDTTLQAYKLAESVALPVMVVLDAFFLSHTYEPVDVPDQEEADRFLPPYEARFELDTKNPCTFGPLVPPAVYMEMRHDMAAAMDTALTNFARIEDEYERIFGRRYGPWRPSPATMRKSSFTPARSPARQAVLRICAPAGKNWGSSRSSSSGPSPSISSARLSRGQRKSPLSTGTFPSGPAASSPRKSAPPCATHRNTRPSSATSPGSGAGM
jgi:pyruvate/2-oxoacid:ferredoxin oxidoreductase alpha subunit